jgi:O-antigen ligase
VGNEAMDSAAGRRQLLLDSIRLTFQHPLFGVGPGQFAQFRWSEGHMAGVRVGWIVTHNAYTQISSENGFPGAIFFIAILVGTAKILRRTKKLNSPGSHNDWELGQTMATALQISFVNLLVCGFFMPNAQYVLWYLMGGMALALERLTAQAIMRQAAMPVNNGQLTNQPRLGMATTGLYGR